MNKINPKIGKYGEERWCDDNGELHRTYGPALIYPNGAEYWYQHGQLHRLGGPAASYANGNKHWFENNNRHRIDGPAVIWADGIFEWYLNGIQITSSLEFRRTGNLTDEQMTILFLKYGEIK